MISLRNSKLWSSKRRMIHHMCVRHIINRYQKMIKRICVQLPICLIVFLVKVWINVTWFLFLSMLIIVSRKSHGLTLSKRFICTLTPAPLLMYGIENLMIVDFSVQKSSFKIGPLFMMTCLCSGRILMSTSAKQSWELFAMLIILHPKIKKFGEIKKYWVLSDLWDLKISSSCVNSN